MNSLCTEYAINNEINKDIYKISFTVIQEITIQSGLGYINLYKFCTLASHYVRVVWLGENVMLS